MNCAETKERAGARQVRWNPITAEIMEEHAETYSHSVDLNHLFRRAASTIRGQAERIAELESAVVAARPEAGAGDPEPGSVAAITAGDFEVLAAEAELSVGCGGYAVAFRRAAGEIRRLEDKAGYWKGMASHSEPRINDLVEQNREATVAIAREEEIRREQKERIGKLAEDLEVETARAKRAEALAKDYWAKWSVAEIERERAERQAAQLKREAENMAVMDPRAEEEDGLPNVVHTLAVDVTDLLRNPVAAVEPAGSIEGFLNALVPNSKMTIILERGE